jgi:hypothetical protein
MATYYVKTAGSDSADGLSDANAWATIAKVNGFTFNAGDMICFNRGDTWAEQLNTPRAGLTLQDYGSGGAAKPIITGSDVRATCITIDEDSTAVYNLSLTDATGANLLVDVNNDIVLSGVDSTQAGGNAFTINGNAIKMAACSATNSAGGIHQANGPYASLYIKTCVVDGNASFGIKCEGTTNLTLVDSSATDTTAGPGLLLMSVAGGNLHDIIATGNAGHGVHLDDIATVGCSGLNLDRITVSSNTGAGNCGVFLDTNADGNFLSRITAVGNVGSGVKMGAGATDNMLSYSVLSGNAYGAWVTADPY